ncbi:flagellar hook-length control protein FliK [Desulfosporosinus youngiae]|uniref:Flagellar hook-length control protein n=1 Tax=Desulfosporosinus youngiae DSM 17734 TaxID=768710 RepID=H5XYN7_9FIRM|nr:flagellar hook-length control protein FliK [Desulfosporosinus youngiae]EHQ91593.1 flagellar hook-length control protein [Desulfosporosinus youngiae DSM 17734]
MTGIHVLSDNLKSGYKSENLVSSKGKEAAGCNDNAAAIFAVVLNGKMNLDSNPKGQSSSKADQDSEEVQSNAANPGQSDQNLNGLGSILGYGNHVLPFLTEMMLQSDLPAGKEANSGERISQGSESSSLANLALTNVSGAAGKDVELASNEDDVPIGMLALNSQGDNLGNAELDKYRRIITNLLVALSGTITDSTSEGNYLGGSTGPKDLSQDLARIVQNWITVTEGVGEEKNSLADSSAANSGGTKDTRQDIGKVVQDWMSTADMSAANDIKNELNTIWKNGLHLLIEGLAVGSGKVDGGNPELNMKAASLLAALYPLLKEEAGNAQAVPGLKEALKELKGLGIDLEFIKSISGTVKDMNAAGFLSDNVHKKFEAMSQQESKALNSFHAILNEEVPKEHLMKSVELSGTKDSHAQPPSTGAGSVANLLPLTLSDGKFVAIPVWEQISVVVREQIMSRQQALKELDIQLHPEDLGKIRILLRWESGQVHLQVQASEAATGQLLQNQLADLRQNLMSQGVNCGSLQMGQEGEGRQQPQGDEAQRTFRPSNSLSNADEDLISMVNSISLGQDGINRINVTA